MGRRRNGARLLLAGATTGAGLTYFFDPDRGRRRRALLRDRIEHTRHDLTRSADIVTRDGLNRGRGLIAEAERLLQREHPSDGRIHHMVRSRIAANSRHPSALRARVTEGHVVLTGPVLADEADRVRAAVRRVPGVESIDDRMELHQEARDIPALQGEGQLSTPRPELLQQHWAPAPRALAGAVGGAILAYGSGRGGIRGLGLLAGGSLLLARAVANVPVRQLTGIGAGPEAVHIEKQIDIDAPVERIWSVLEDYEQFPTFMSHIRDVTREGDGWSHWRVDGPFGTCVEWDAEVTEVHPRESLSWRSRPGAAIRHAGELSLQSFDGKSRIRVSLDYNPAAGVAGHAVARLLGSDAKRHLDDDLLRMKTMIETGNRPRDAARQ